MPLYEYLCKTCGYTFEVLQLKKEDEREVECPRCKSKDTQKLISGFTAIGRCEKKGFT
ncbi:MAG: zinc ribbon domain-containing protein [Deltaproteobacteria bacterium]|nr:MAG: zinc ribbon domain-containing protein [Deltaproteobacteria bacterium]